MKAEALELSFLLFLGCRLGLWGQGLGSGSAEQVRGVIEGAARAGGVALLARLHGGGPAGEELGAAAARAGQWQHPRAMPVPPTRPALDTPGVDRPSPPASPRAA